MSSIMAADRVPLYRIAPRPAISVAWNGEFDVCPYCQMGFDQQLGTMAVARYPTVTCPRCGNMFVSELWKARRREQLARKSAKTTETSPVRA